MDCPTFKLPDNSRADARKGNELTIRCTNMNKMWTIRCEDTTWIGDLDGQCEGVPVEVKTGETGEIMLLYMFLSPLNHYQSI